MGYCTAGEDFDRLRPVWEDVVQSIPNIPPFLLPAWQTIWWRHFGNDKSLYLRAIEREGTLLGVAPLLRRDNIALFIGNADIVDYMDFPIRPGNEADFFRALLDQLLEDGIEFMELASVRYDSTVMTTLAKVAAEAGFGVDYDSEDMSLVIDPLPSTWEDYLATLRGKQRHEVRRKLKRLTESFEAIDYRMIRDAAQIEASIVLFFQLFRESRPDKSQFMTASMQDFFVDMIRTMARQNVLRLGMLSLDDSPAAMVLCFDYQGTVYLYNSAYDPKYKSWSVGLLSKVLCIKDSIARGRRRFDFLKGPEEYKYRLGGREVPIYTCRVSLLR